MNAGDDPATGTANETATNRRSQSSHTRAQVERVQTGIRLERRLLKVLKALAEYLDVSLGDLVEGVALHVFEGKAPFSPETLRVIEDLKRVYGLTLTAEDSHLLIEVSQEEAKETGIDLSGVS